MATQLKTLPDPQRLDRLAFDNHLATYVGLRASQETARQAAEMLKPLILSDVERFGLVPTNAEKSRRLEGSEYVATLTTGDTIEVNDAAATELELLLSRARRPKLFGSIFTRRVEYSLTESAQRTVETTAWPKKFADEIRTLYARCFRASKRTPVLKIEKRADVEARETAAAGKRKSKGATAAVGVNGGR